MTGNDNEEKENTGYRIAVHVIVCRVLTLCGIAV
jgi:hypothetical protein